MTIICIKDKKLAWDSQVTSAGNFRWGEISDKVEGIKKNGQRFYIGGCGNLQHIQSFKKRLKEMSDEDFEAWIAEPKHSCPSSSTLFLFDPGLEILYEFAEKGPAVALDVRRKSYAIGVGSEYAYGVMDSGKSSYEAVKMVIGRFDGCGLPIHKAGGRK